MVAISERRTFPEDIAFQEATGKLYGAGESVRGKPLDFGRRGGASLGQAGDLYTTLLGAASRALGKRDLARGARDLNWERAARLKAAETQAARTQGVADVISGTFGAISDEVAKRMLADDEPKGPTITPPTTPLSGGGGYHLEGRDRRQGLGGVAPDARPPATPPATPQAKLPAQAEAVIAAPVVVSPFSPTDPYEYAKIPGQQYPWSFREKGSGGEWTPFNYAEHTIQSLDDAAAGRVREMGLLRDPNPELIRRV